MGQNPENPKVEAEQQVDVEACSQTGDVADETSASVAGAPGTARAEPPTHVELLLKTVETDLIPRLFVNHMMDIPTTSPLVENSVSQPRRGPWCSEDAIRSFAGLCIGNDPDRLDAHVTDLMAGGVSLESIFLYLFEPVARHLGDQWLSDQLSFMDVQLGLIRLHQLVCDCEAVGYHSENTSDTHQSILLACAPGEDHTFGLTMVADFFRRYGWYVNNLSGLETDYVLEKVSDTDFAVAGFSLHHSAAFPALTDLIRQVRSQSRNADIIIMVGGDYFIQNPDQMYNVGADVFAGNGKEAVLKAASACKTRGRFGQHRLHS